MDIVSLAEVNYNGYCASSGGVSLVSGAVLPEFSSATDPVKRAWAAGAQAVASTVTRAGKPTGIYRVTWERVQLASVPRFSEPDPAASCGYRQTVPNSEIPDEHWEPASGGVSSTPWEQRNALATLDKENVGFVRNIRMEELVSEPVWAEAR